MADIFIHINRKISLKQRRDILELQALVNDVSDFLLTWTMVLNTIRTYSQSFHAIHYVTAIEISKM